MSYPIEEIQGIGEKFGEKLREAGIATAEALLEAARTPQGREELAEKAGFDADTIRDWANHADLMRIDGIGGQFAELLEASGVDTVKELATRNAENLAEKMEEVNAEKNLANRVPSADMLQEWIDGAGKMEPMMEY